LENSLAAADNPKSKIQNPKSKKVYNFSLDRKLEG
jgi:hypothetical protein